MDRTFASDSMTREAASPIALRASYTCAMSSWPMARLVGAHTRGFNMILNDMVCPKTSSTLASGLRY
eukprot:11314898-Karenia_brevis.AAC.1